MSSAIGHRRRRPGIVEERAERRRERTAGRRGAEAIAGDCASDPTLESKLLTTWAALVAGYPVECPVCGGPLTAASGCSRCGSRLT